MYYFWLGREAEEILEVHLALVEWEKENAIANILAGDYEEVLL